MCGAAAASIYASGAKKGHSASLTMLPIGTLEVGQRADGAWDRARKSIASDVQASEGLQLRKSVGQNTGQLVVRNN